METLEVNVPMIIELFMITDFAERNKDLQKLNKRLRVVKLDSNNYGKNGYKFDGYYLGLVYLAGKKPTKYQISVLLREAGLEEGLDEEHNLC
ncbi:hypothetical protein HN803_04590 [candidate division WWE3 bacterium]|jgi:hypothetical protein|nr:hypothetical protein [Candidatus Scalindua sp.]MBT7350041.1 hypothetical protein [candidate division WWE3 bacterium]